MLTAFSGHNSSTEADESEEGHKPVVEADRMRVSVIGTGYLGATTAACLAEMGFEVIGLDVDEAKIEILRSGRVPFYEPGLDGSGCTVKGARLPRVTVSATVIGLSMWETCETRNPPTSLPP